MSHRAAHRLDKIPKFTVWQEFTPLAVKHKAVNLGQGFPSFNPEPFVLQHASAAIHDVNPLAHQYARGLGHLELVSCLQRKYAVQLGRSSPIAAVAPTATADGSGSGLQNDEVLILNGTTQALSCACQAFISDGDEVVMFEPFFDLYINDIEMCGGKPIIGTLQPPTATMTTTTSGTTTTTRASEWRVDFDALERRMTPRTKMILLNTPQNVPGKVWSLDELQCIADIARRRDLLVIADEVYDHLLFDGAEHVSIASLPGMWERTITVASAGKTLTVTGWKVGWAIAPKELILPMSQVFANQAFSVATPLQVAVARSLTEASTNGYFDRLLATYNRRREKLCTMLSNVGLPPVIPQGAFFALADISNIRPEAYVTEKATAEGVARDWQFCRWLTTEIGVTAIPVTAFCTESSRPMFDRYVRFAFCKTDEAIEEAGRILAEKLPPHRRH